MVAQKVVKWVVLTADLKVVMRVVGKAAKLADVRDAWMVALSVVALAVLLVVLKVCLKVAMWAVGSAAVSAVRSESLMVVTMAAVALAPTRRLWPRCARGCSCRMLRSSWTPRPHEPSGGQ